MGSPFLALTEAATVPYYLFGSKQGMDNKIKFFISLFFVSTGAYGAQVIEVHSGDTLTVIEKGRPITLRLANVDAPELDQPYGAAARKSLEELCKGKDADYESLDRTAGGPQSASIVCDGIDAGRTQLKRGLAWVRPRKDIDASFTLIQDFVWRDKIGLWADADPVPPWEWAERRR
jgi:micrococcal nuclease